MAGSLTFEQVGSYERDGYLFPVACSTLTRQPRSGRLLRFSLSG